MIKYNKDYTTSTKQMRSEKNAKCH